jgi:glutamine---fructose-6-phosphate transaminase (isomerizing)
MLGAHFEAEIRQQPPLWRKLAASDLPARLASSFEVDEVCFIGSGSSLIAGELGAIALLRCGVRAYALAATEAAFAIEGIRDATVVAISQSGQSGDVLKALDVIAPRQLVAVTNDASSPLASRADDVIELGIGVEEAIPATKSVSVTMALLLLAASHRMGTLQADAAALVHTADAVAIWLGSETADMIVESRKIAVRPSVAILGSGFGLPVARELALKLKEASYLHAEAFAVGEFRHGNMAMLDPTYSVLAIADTMSRATVAPLLEGAKELQALCMTIGAEFEGIERIGHILAPPPFEVLGSLVAGQMLALQVGRARLVDSDAPRSLTKYVR